MNVRRPSREWYRARILECGDDLLISAFPRDLDAAPDQEIAEEPAQGMFGAFVNLKRRSASLTVDQLATRLEVEVKELRRIESDTGYVARPRTLQRIAEFAGVPLLSLAELSGATRPEGSPKLDTQMRFAAKAEELMALSKQERELLREFIQFLTNERKSG